MIRRARRVGLILAAVLLALPAAAGAHAEISPKVSLSGQLQLYSLAVPTEKSGATTTQVVLTVPSGFSIDSFVPTPGWHRVLQQSGSGDNAVIQKVTWTGGHTRDRGGFAVPVPRPARLDRHLHLHRPADLLRRLARRLVGTGDGGRAGSAD